MLKFLMFLSFLSCFLSFLEKLKYFRVYIFIVAQISVGIHFNIVIKACFNVGKFYGLSYFSQEFDVIKIWKNKVFSVAFVKI